MSRERGQDSVKCRVQGAEYLLNQIAWILGDGRCGREYVFPFAAIYYHYCYCQYYYYYFISTIPSDIILNSTMGNPDLTGRGYGRANTQA